MKKILIADDDSAIRDVMTIILKEEGYTVLAEPNGSNVEKKVISHMPQLILLDISLSGEDGSSIVQKLKKNEQTKPIPILLVSGNDAIADIKEKSGADGYIMKPFTLEGLLAAVKNYV